MKSEIKYKSFCKKNISNIAFGCATLANIYNPISEIDSCDLVNHAFNRGINYFDVAPFYGGGLAEKRLGICIKNLSRNTSRQFRFKIARSRASQASADA